MTTFVSDIFCRFFALSEIFKKICFSSNRLYPINIIGIIFRKLGVCCFFAGVWYAFCFNILLST